MEFQNISPNQKNPFLEEINVDVNNVLNFSINIDNLKLLLTTLIKNQSALSQKIFDLENKIKGRSRTNSIRDKSTNSIRDKSRRNNITKSPSSESIIKLDKEEKEENIEKIKEKEKEIANGSDNSNLKQNENIEEKNTSNENNTVEENGDKNLSMQNKEINKENTVM